MGDERIDSSASTSSGRLRSDEAREGPQWEAGRVVARRYVLERKLGGGANADVWLAEDRLLRKPVALKVLQTELAQSRDTVRRFLREVALAHSVTHRNVVRIYDTGEEDGLPFFTMEYLRGKTLEELLGDPETGLAEPIDFDEIRTIALDVLDAMRSAHRVGVIHRDLKPSNVILTHRGAIVMDFGVAGIEEVAEHSPNAASIRSLVRTETGTIFGSPAYMAPELWEGAPATVQSDLYAFGVMLYQMVSGRLPYDGSSPAAYLAQLNAAPPRPLRHWRRDTPWKLVRLIERCMAQEPERRPTSAEAAANLLSPLGRGRARRLITIGVIAAGVALAVGLSRLRPERAALGLPDARSEAELAAVLRSYDYGDTEAALRQLERLAQRAPDSAAVAFWRATLLEELGDETARQAKCQGGPFVGDQVWVELAEAACSEAPFHLPPTAALEILSGSGDWPAELLPLAIEHDQIPRLETSASQDEDERARARALLEQLNAGSSPDEPRALPIRRALAAVDLELALGRTAEARERLDVLLEREPSAPIALGHAAWLAALIGDLDRAATLAARVRPVDPQPWLSLQMRVGKLEEAWSEIEEHEHSTRREALRRLWCGYAWRYGLEPPQERCRWLSFRLPASLWSRPEEPLPESWFDPLEVSITTAQHERDRGRCDALDPGPSALTHAPSPFELRLMELAIEAALCPDQPEAADLGRAQALAAQLTAVAPADPFVQLLHARIDEARGETSQARARRLTVAELWRDADPNLPVVAELAAQLGMARTASAPR